MPTKDTIDEHMERLVLPLDEYMRAIGKIVGDMSSNVAKMSVIEFIGSVDPRGFKHINIIPITEVERGVIKTTWRVERVRSIERSLALKTRLFAAFFPDLAG